MDKQQIVTIIDFWLKSAQTESALFERDVVEKINITSKEIIDIVGSRRSGKSSIFKLLIKKLNLKDSFLYINFEDPFFINNNQPEIIEELISVFKEYFNKNLKYLFFDEIQEIKHWQRVIRKLRDGAVYHIFITGSSAQLLSGEMATLLTGRHLSYETFPLSFSEFINFKGLVLKSKKDIVLQEASLVNFFDKYLLIGGYPEIVLTEKEELLKTYFFDILQKDVLVRHKVRDKEVLNKLTVYLLSNSGNLISERGLSETLKTSNASINNYLEYLKEAFLIFDLGQFSYSLKKQNRAPKKIYAVDSGLARVASFKFSENYGHILEGVVLAELKRLGKEVYYYKTNNGLEVDFLVKEKNKIDELIQVSWTLDDEETKKREIKGLVKGLEELKLNNGLLLTHDEEDEIKIKNKKITVKPVWQWLLE